MATGDVLISMFADDVRIAKPIATDDDIRHFQTVINAILVWCNENDLQLNLEKCSVMILHRGRSPPEPDYKYGDYRFHVVTSQRDLGVMIHNRLNFVNHIGMIVAKAHSALGFVKRFCYEINDHPTLKAVYCAFVQSNLDYCSTIWLTIPTIRSEMVYANIQMYKIDIKSHPTKIDLRN